MPWVLSTWANVVRGGVMGLSMGLMGILGGLTTPTEHPSSSI